MVAGPRKKTTAPGTVFLAREGMKSRDSLAVKRGLLAGNVGWAGWLHFGRNGEDELVRDFERKRERVGYGANGFLTRK